PRPGQPLRRRLRTAGGPPGRRPDPARPPGHPAVRGARLLPRLPRGVRRRRLRPLPARPFRLHPPGRRLRPARRGVQRHALPGPAVAPRTHPVPGQPRAHRPVGDALRRPAGPGRPPRPAPGALGAHRSAAARPAGRRLPVDRAGPARDRGAARAHPGRPQRCGGARSADGALRRAAVRGGGPAGRVQAHRPAAAAVGTGPPGHRRPAGDRRRRTGAGTPGAPGRTGRRVHRTRLRGGEAPAAVRGLAAAAPVRRGGVGPGGHRGRRPPHPGRRLRRARPAGLRGGRRDRRPGLRRVLVRGRLVHPGAVRGQPGTHGRGGPGPRRPVPLGPHGPAVPRGRHRGGAELAAMSDRGPKDPSIRRSLALFRAFLREQDDPDACYALLARDAADQVEAYDGPVAGRVVVDVGGGSGHFTQEFRARGAHAYLFEPDARELAEKPPEATVIADGYLLPLCEGAADVTFSSNVLEHVADPQTFLSELVRVTRPGGLIYVSFTNWLSPWGG